MERLRTLSRTHDSGKLHRRARSRESIISCTSPLVILSVDIAADHPLFLSDYLILPKRFVHLQSYLSQFGGDLGNGQDVVVAHTFTCVL